MVPDLVTFSMSMGLSPALLKAFRGSGLLSLSQNRDILVISQINTKVIPSLNSSCDNVLLGHVYSWVFLVNPLPSGLGLGALPDHVPPCPHLLQTWARGSHITLCPPSFLHLLHFSGSGQSAIP